MIGLARLVTGAGGGHGPSLNFNFVDGSAFSPQITFTRASSATMFDSSGTLVYAPMNAIRNSSASGAVAGTPGTLPTNWTSASIGGVALTEVVGTGVEDGIAYVDVRYTGTTSSTASGGITAEGTNQIVAASGQTWTNSFYVRLVNGSLSGINTVANTIQERDSGGNLLAATNTAITPTTAPLNTQRVNTTRTLNNASTAFVNPQVRITPASGVAIDITLRIGLPQLELGSVARTAVATNGTAYQGPRLDYDPATLAARGLLIEEQRTNSIRNNTMQGAVAGTPGTAPTNWLISGAGTLASEIVGVGTESGVDYIDFRLSGTTSTTNTILLFDATTQITSASTQTWASSFFVKLQSGSTTNIASVANEIRGYSSGGVIQEQSSDAITLTASFTRDSHVFTLANAGSVRVINNVRLNFASGVAIDITLRIGLPQLELGSVARTAIATSGTAYQGPRFDYDPDTLAARGFLIEEARTNSIRNNTMVGAVAGTPGTNPTNWDVVVSGSGITREVVGTGTEDGITYIDLRFYGTGSGLATPQIRPETTTEIVASAGQTWAASYYLRIVGGSTTGISSFNQVWQERDAAGVTLNAVSVPISAPTTAALKTQRSILTRTLTDAGTVRLTNRVQCSFTNGVAVDITLRIGLPQLELGAFTTSVIPTTTTALTRSADVASVNTLSPWFNATASTVYFEGTVATVSDSQTPYFWSINDNTKAFGAREQIAYTRAASSAQTVGLVAAGGATNASVASSNTVVTANTVFKAAASYAANDVKVCVNGLTPATTASATLPTGLNTLKLGVPGWSAALVANAFYIRRITYYPRRLSNADLQALTA